MDRRTRGDSTAVGGPTRRTLLAASLTAPLAAAPVAVPLLAVPLLAVAGCRAPEAARPGRDVTVLRAAIAAKERLIALYTTVQAAHPPLARRLDPLLRDNTAHLTELKRRLIEPAKKDGSQVTLSPETPETLETAETQRTPRTPGSSQPAATAGSPSPVPSGRGAALAALRSAEHAAARVHVLQLRTVTPSLAQLLASIAACEATHVAALGRKGLAP